MHNVLMAQRGILKQIKKDELVTDCIIEMVDAILAIIAMVIILSAVKLTLY